MNPYKLEKRKIKEYFTAEELDLYKKTNKIKGLKIHPLSKPFIYFLFQDKKLVYIGQSFKLSSRILQHYVSEKIFNNFTFISIFEFMNKNSDLEIIRKKMLEIEKFLIKKYRPEYNKACNPDCIPNHFHPEIFDNVKRKLMWDIWKKYNVETTLYKGKNILAYCRRCNKKYEIHREKEVKEHKEKHKKKIKNVE